MKINIKRHLQLTNMKVRFNFIVKFCLLHKDNFTYIVYCKEYFILTFITYKN